MKVLRDPLGWGVLALVALALALPHSQPLFAALFPALERPVYLQEPFVDLLAEHLLLVAVSSAAAVLLGSTLGWLITRRHAAAFAGVADALAALGQTCPPVAVLALTVPLLGFGVLPALVALTLYGLLPVLQGTVAGLRAVPDAVMDAATGLGLSSRQCFWQVEVPLALPVWLAAIRTSVIINISTAAVASTVGAKTLGSPIIVGLSGFNTAYVLQGALLVGALALVVDQAFERLAKRAAWRS